MLRSTQKEVDMVIQAALACGRLTGPASLSHSTRWSMRVKKYIHGRLDIRPRKHGPSVWQFRFSENGKLRAVTLGTTVQLPTPSDAERAAEPWRVRINSGNQQQRMDTLTVGNSIDKFLAEELANDRRFMTQ